MSTRMTNPSTKVFLVKQSNLPMFGSDFDHRKSAMTDDEAEKRFDTVWKERIEREVDGAEYCTVAFVREHVDWRATGFINEEARHVNFKLDRVSFIAQLTAEGECDQLWRIPSAVRDPWTVYVKFAEVPIRKEFEAVAHRLGWNRPEDLAEKLVVDFLESVTRKQVARRYLRDGTSEPDLKDFVL